MYCLLWDQTYHHSDRSTTNWTPRIQLSHAESIAFVGARVTAYGTSAKRSRGATMHAWHRHESCASAAVTLAVGASFSASSPSLLQLLASSVCLNASVCAPMEWLTASKTAYDVCSVVVACKTRFVLQHVRFLFWAPNIKAVTDARNVVHTALDKLPPSPPFFFFRSLSWT